MAITNGDLHIVMLPWSAFGHMFPYYQLSISLAKKGVRISYVSTPKTIERLPKIPPNLAHLMQFVSLPLPIVVGSASSLPQGAEATVDLEVDQVPYLNVAYDLLREPFKHFVLNNPPDWIICDFLAHWMPDLAKECNIPLMSFSVYPASTGSFFGPPEHYLAREGDDRHQKPVTSSTTETWPTTPPHWGTGVFPPSVAFKGYEAAGFRTGVNSQNASGISAGERISRTTLGCQVVCIRSCREFEGKYLELYQNLIHKPVLPTGVLPSLKIEKKEKSNTTDETWIEVFKWLDKQIPGSVIYVGFGSEYKLTKDEIHEIAYGLELAQLPFIWALRRPTWTVDDSEVLPPGFVNRTIEKGIVSLGWAPQAEILAHPSIGGSLFHSGWGSIIETLQHGHNLILLPFVFDQGLNARVIVEKGLGIEVERKEDGSFTKVSIADALRRAMLGDEAQKIKAQAKEVAKIFSDQELQEEHYIGELVDYLRNGAKSQ